MTASEAKWWDSKRSQCSNTVLFIFQSCGHAGVCGCGGGKKCKCRRGRYAREEGWIGRRGNITAMESDR